MRAPSVESLLASDESEREGSEREEMQPMQPLEFYFKSNEFPKTSKIQTKCFVTKTVKLIKEDDVAWFAVNGVPIRYSMREHALISGLDCGDYLPNYDNLGGYKFVDYYFHDRKKITISDVKQKMFSMPPCPDRLKMTGRLTFEDAIKEIKHVMNHLKGEVKEACTFPGFIIPLEVLTFYCISDLGKTFRIYSDDASEDCPRMCKSWFTKSSLKGYPLEDIYAAVGETKVINSVLVPTIGEQIMLARIIDEERVYDRQASPSCTRSVAKKERQRKGDVCRRIIL
ncbi:uncharacterized protein At3g43530-like [Brassica napus]|uniref:uncharacterized protein At3g43530-like n=1 Tax=Brassica oleracea var. oleracea TaxID=109376 RepID=UPI0006A71E95|nr:PREDICTED: uncharacterized protein At3g43530-like [Brassica oleracea var. oleracea]XP_048615681.1 uncharacterized protein At3g43530-like [Brassica napus]